MTNDDIKMMTYLPIDVYTFSYKHFYPKLMTIYNKDFM